MSDDLYDESISKACIFPPFHLIDQFADDLLINKTQKLPMSELLTTFAQLSKIGGSYFQRDLSEICSIADIIEEVENLTL